MAEKHAVAEREDGRPPPAVRAEECMTDRVDATVDRNEPPRAHPAVDRIG